MALLTAFYSITIGFKALRVVPTILDELIDEDAHPRIN
jgi:hypothetical protein